MENKLKKFLLIDDSQSTNVFNKRIIEKTCIVENVAIAKNGVEALKHLQTETIPEVIFLDINMPIMNGWEFMSAYQKLEKKYRSSVVILMLGAALNEEDEKLAKSIKEIKEFREKMLSAEAVDDIVNTYFV